MSENGNDGLDGELLMYNIATTVWIEKQACWNIEETVSIIEHAM